MEAVENQNILVEWLFWHFYDMPKFLVSVWKNYLLFGLDYFSVPLLLKTLFSPWRRYNWAYPKQISIVEYLNTFISNIVSRILGAICRFVLIILGIITQIFIVVAGIVLILLWFFIPFILILEIYSLLFKF